MRNQKPLEIKAFWDSEACVWVASSEDIKGLATEAATMEDLIRKLNIMVPELLKANGYRDDLDEVPFMLCSEYRNVAARRAA